MISEECAVDVQKVAGCKYLTACRSLRIKERLLKRTIVQSAANLSFQPIFFFYL